MTNLWMWSYFKIVKSGMPEPLTKRKFLCSAFLLLSLLPFDRSMARGENSIAPYLTSEAGAVEDSGSTGIILPFVFSTESTGFGYGAAGGSTGYQDGQMGLYGAGFVSENDSAAIYLLGSDIRVPFTRRLFFDPYVTYGWFALARDYFGGNPAYPGEQAGSNESSPNNFIETSGREDHVEVRFKYVLPLGNGRANVIQRYVLDRGILVDGASGGVAWNPLVSGVTYLQFKPFYLYRTFEFPTPELRGSTSGFEAGIHYDNRDFPPNPTSGSKMHLTYAGDFGRLNDWSVVKGEVTKYISLGKTEKLRQQVLALGLWVADNYNLKARATPTGIEYEHRAVPTYGPALGGLYRMRAYPQDRFHDKVAVYYGAEYRVIPKWNPLGKFGLLKVLDIDWWQFVGIVEVGRVDSGWSVDTLCKDMQWNVGVGVRLMTRKVVVRLDAAFSDEGGALIAMAGHAF